MILIRYEWWGGKPLLKSAIVAANSFGHGWRTLRYFLRRLGEPVPDSSELSASEVGNNPYLMGSVVLVYIGRKDLKGDGP